MFSRRTGSLLFASAVLAAGCSNHPASDAVKAFKLALADSSWTEAWNMLTPETQAVWDSTASVMKQFGYTESLDYLSALETPVTQDEFTELDGEILFVRMVQSAPGITRISGAVRSVEMHDSLTALVTVSTVDGAQVIPVRLTGEYWLIDLTTLSPPPAGSHGEQ